jgi:hypothetical protein
MVDWFGRWREEKDYSTYPETKWCAYDYMAVWIRGKGYEPKTSMENLIDMIFLHYDAECEEEMKDFYVDDCIAFVRASGGIEMFDYEP